MPAQSHLFWEGFMAWQLHPTASAGDRFQGSNKPPTVVDGLWSHHTGHYMLYFACHAEPVRLTEHLPCPRTSEQKKENELSEDSAIAGHAHVLALLSLLQISHLCVFSLQRWCTGCRVPFSDPRCFLLVTVYPEDAHSSRGPAAYAWVHGVGLPSNKICWYCNR